MAQRNAIWTDVLRIANEIVALRPERLAPHGSAIRMADWGAFVQAAAVPLGWNVGTAHQALHKLAYAQADLALSGDETAGLGAPPSPGAQTHLDRPATASCARSVP